MLDMCGRGLMRDWGSHGDASGPRRAEKLQSEPRRSRGTGKHRWQKPSGLQRRRANCPDTRKNRAPLPRVPAASLRPANVQGNRAPGMRAPRNTNQFLMREKYQMLHMRSDSVGTDSGSDCEMDFADMDSYLRVLENARGALLDSPDPPPTPAFYARRMKRHQPFPFFSFDQDESLQYYPSEDDVMQSEEFMQRDFKEFCSAVNTVAPCV